MNQSKFIHLHVRSDYSMIDGLAKVDMLIQKTKLLKMSALALTDFCNLFGCIKFYDFACAAGIKPIIGVDFLMQNDMDINVFNNITCLATNNKGYQNIVHLISKAYKCKCSNTNPVIQQSWFKEYNEGLILLSGGKNGDIGKCLLQNKISKVNRYLLFYEQYFSNRYYLELHRTGRQHEELYLQLALELSIKNGIPVVATNDVRFLDAKDFQAHEIRVAINDGVILSNIENNQLRKYNSHQFMKSEEEMCILFSDIPESLANSVEIAYRCNMRFHFDSAFIPKFPTGSITDKDFLIIQAKKGLEERLTSLFPTLEERNIGRTPYDLRLHNELDVINQMGFPSYFLIVMEFIQWAKNNDIPVGPGRGSGASSLVAYALKITELDPLKFDLLFERFLNPERISMPDLDIDFCMERRDLVIEHVIEVYGTDAVSQIITFGTMTAKAVIRDVGRALGMSYVFVNRIAKLIPTEIGITLEKACSIDSQLKSLYKNNEDVKLLINTARQLEGVIKNVSKHAGGVVISPTKITDFSPLYYDTDHISSMTQFDKDDIERIGLIKFDFLGLRTLTIIDRAVKMINKKHIRSDHNIIDINTISLNDKASFCMLQSAETTAVFQLESNGIKELIKRLKPDCFEDLIALVALFRPGPLQSGMVDNFINRKHGREIISYPDIKWQHTSLRSVLNPTYGIILYQEQVMQIAQVFAGYTLGNADILRRAISKKKLKEMEQQRIIFNSGAAQNNNIDINLSSKIFDLVEKFAGYGFNKSHSAAYALISYQTLWLKTHYSAEFMASVLSADMDNLDKIAHLIHECKKMKLIILPPDINISQYHFYVNKKKEIVYGMGAIKGIGQSSIEAIIAARKQKGAFKDLYDFCIRVENAKINRRVFEKLIFSGAFDVFGIYRSQLMLMLDDVIKYTNKCIDKKNNKQMDMFTEYLSIPYHKNIDSNYCGITLEWSNQFLLKKEKESLGLYLSSHPIIQYIEEIKRHSIFPKITKIQDVYQKKNNDIIKIFALVISIKVKLNKKSNHIVICILEDYSGRLEVIVPSNILHKYQCYLKENNILFIEGFTSFDKLHGGFRMVAQKIGDIDRFRKKYAHSLSIVLLDKQIDNNILKKIHFLLKQNTFKGIIPVYFYYQKNGIEVKLCCGKKWKIIPTTQLLSDLHNLLGDAQIKLELH